MSPNISKISPKTLFAKRLKKIIGCESFRSFESKCELSNGSIVKIMHGRSPNLETIQSIILTTGCNADWLITGRGKPFND